MARRLKALSVGEALAACGGIVFLATMLLAWFAQRSAGGTAGQGRGEPAVAVNAWEAFGLLAAFLAIAASLAIVHAGMRIAARPSPALLAPVGGLLTGVLAVVGSAVVLGNSACCDLFYTASAPRFGMYAGLVAAVVSCLGGILVLRGR